MICEKCEVGMTETVTDSISFEAFPHIDVRITCPECGLWLHKTLSPSGELISWSKHRGSASKVRNK